MRAHRLGRGGEEVAPAVPSGVFGPHQPKIRFVNQRRGLERLARRFSGEFLRGQAAQFGVDQREQLLRGPRVALLDGREDSGYFVHGPTAPGVNPSTSSDRFRARTLGVTHEGWCE